MIKSILKIFGTKNDKIIKSYLKKVNTINALESQYEAMDDSTLKMMLFSL
jgi:preprotein translocase subunit SecA